ncbi:protein kinase [Kribbella sp. NPDC051770]|uniref:protein kinase domain-containing protein n=1 Tax=Kribbella sp. NPDC051770 TaxID=3155413 RepID=UPI0034158B14
MALDDIAGYSLRRKLGSGSAGTVWLVRDLASGRHAALKRIPTPTITDPTTFERDLTTLLTIDHPHLARLIEARQSDQDWLLFTQHVPAGNLSALLSRRGDLSKGELVTLISPLADAISVLHQHNLHHGRLTPNNVLFDADGRPVITDTALRSQTPTTPADDVQALSTLTHLAAGSTPVPPTLFTQATPQAISRNILTLAPPAPLNLAFPTTDPPSPRPPTPTPALPTQTPLRPPVQPTRRKPRRNTPHRARRDNTTRLNKILTTHRAPRSRRTTYGILAATALAALIVTAVAITTLGVLNTPTANPAAAAPQTPLSTPKPTPPLKPTPSPSPQNSSTSWHQTLQSLDALRAHAFLTLNPAELDNIYQPGTHPWTTDRAAIATYKSQNIRIANLRFQIQHLTQEPTPGPTVTLRVTDRLISATALTPSGPTHLPPGPPTTRRITLTPTGKTWRITTITPA